MILDQALVDVIVVGGPPVIALLLLILVTGARKVWVWGRELEDAESRCEKVSEERDEWRELALQGTALAEFATRKKVIGQ